MVDMLTFLPLTYFYVLSLPALGVVERRPPLSGSAERPLRVGERQNRGQLESISPAHLVPVTLGHLFMGLTWLSSCQ